MVRMSFSRCFSSLGCPELSLDAVVALAVKHDIPLVELRALGGSVDLPAYLQAQFGAPAAMATHLGETPVRIVALNTTLHAVGTTVAERDELVAFAPWADALGAKWLRVFDGGTNADADELRAAAETFRWWRTLRAERGWKADIMVETHDSLLHADAIARFVAAVPAAAILWDAHHTWRKGAEDPVATWRTIRPHVVHVHVKDSVGIPSVRHPFTYVLPGDGEFPIAPLLTALRDDAFAGAVSLEWEKLWHPYLPPLDTALTTAADRHWW
jgi:sugar phosphate isomerase/epimerase